MTVGFKVAKFNSLRQIKGYGLGRLQKLLQAAFVVTQEVQNCQRNLGACNRWKGIYGATISQLKSLSKY